IGAFGGATRYAIDLLEQRDPSEANRQWVRWRATAYEGLLGLYQMHGCDEGYLVHDAAVERIRELGAKGIGNALSNGLDEGENRDLFYGTDIYRMVELILRGLGRTGV